MGETPEEGGHFDFVLNNKIKIIYILNFYKKNRKTFYNALRMC